MKLHPSIELLLTEIETFRQRADMTASAFGRTAVNDPNFVGDLRRGRIPSLTLIDRVREFMHSGASSQSSKTGEAA
jgi:hypothetical protein